MDEIIHFLTALYRGGILSQIPKSIQIATTGHGRTLASPIGTFEFFKVQPALVKAGINWSDSRHCPYRIATVEKALLDTLYISTRKSKRFAALPEIELTDEAFNHKTFQQLLKAQIGDLRIRKAVTEKYLRLKAAYA